MTGVKGSPIAGLVLLVALGLGLGVVYSVRQQRRNQTSLQACEKQLHGLAKSLEDARWHSRPQRYVTCLLELEQLEGKRTPAYYDYTYRVEGDGQSYQLTCRQGHAGHWPAYSNQRGLYEGSPEGSPHRDR